MKPTLKLLGCATLAWLLFVPVAQSATINWTNTTGGSWNTAENWDPNQVPASGDTATIPGTGVAVFIDATNSVGGLSLGGGSSLTVASNGLLNLSGAGDKALWGVLTNAGTVVWTGSGTLNLSYNGAIYNLAGGLFDIQNDQ